MAPLVALLRARDPSRHRLALVLALALPVYWLGCIVTLGGLASEAYPADVNMYHLFANNVIDDGLVPYDDFFMEYPPGALLAFLPPALLADDLYAPVFKLAMAFCGAISMAIVAGLLVRRRVAAVELLVGVGLVAVSPLLLGHVYLNRYDPFAALLGVIALAVLLSGRVRSGAAWLALAFVTKVFVAAALPVVAIRVLRRNGRRALIAGAAWFALVTAVAFVPFALVGAGGLRAAFVFQAERLLQTESLGGSLLLAAERLGLYDARIVAGLSVDLGGGLPDALAALSTLVSLAAIAAVAIAYALGSDDDERLILGFAAAVVAFTAFSKAVSPQYLVWIVPLVALVGWRTLRLAAPITAVASLATFISQHGFEGLTVEAWAVWLLVVRNVLLVLLFALLVAALWRTRAAAVSG